MKKRIAAASVCALMMSAFVTAFVCGDVFAVLPSPGQTLATDNKQRDIVLVMDTSGSMAGEPLGVAKEAALAFCESTLEKTSDTRIAIIRFSSSASLVCDFSFDAGILADTVNDFYSGGGTDTEEALWLAHQVMEGNGRSGAIHAVVLLSDGLPEDGSLYDEPDARYTSDVYGFSAPYASAVYNTALTMQRYDIY
ncbi:MAG: VWA domain-containing protein, partial [Clostridiales Family XIII bacterium]|nr:VWA domain-containing protein [Clostridiales Family XIII bacterium]